MLDLIVRKATLPHSETQVDIGLGDHVGLVAVGAVGRQVGPRPAVQNLALVEGIGHARQRRVVFADVLGKQANVVEGAELVVNDAAVVVVAVYLGGAESQDRTGGPDVALVALLAVGKVVQVFPDAALGFRIEDEIDLGEFPFQQHRVATVGFPLVAEAAPLAFCDVSYQEAGLDQPSAGCIAAFELQVEVLNKHRAGRELPGAVGRKADLFSARQGDETLLVGPIRPQLGVDSKRDDALCHGPGRYVAVESGSRNSEGWFFILQGDDQGLVGDAFFYSVGLSLCSGA